MKAAVTPRSHASDILSEPEFSSGIITTMDGIQMAGPEPNPRYVSGTLRRIRKKLARSRLRMAATSHQVHEVALQALVLLMDAPDLAPGGGTGSVRSPFSSPAISWMS